MTSASLFVYTLSMKKAIIFSIILLFPLCAYAHPGKTDYRGGHKCWKNCSEWELRYREYHLHDKDWKPIRLNEKGLPIKTVQTEPMPSVKSPEQDVYTEHTEQTRTTSSAEETIPEVPKTDKKVITEYNRIVTVYEEGIVPVNLMFLLIMLLALIIILLFLRRKRKKQE